MTPGLLARLAWRSIWRNRRRTIITVASIAIGLAIAIFFIAFADGVYAQLIENAARMQAGHITLERPGYRRAPNTDLFLRQATALQARVTAVDGVALVKRLVVGQAIARTGAGMVGVAVVGVEPAIEARSSPLARHMVKGAYLAGTDDAEVVVGRELATRLHVDIGNKIVLTANDIGGNLVDELCRVKGIFDSGSTEIDGHLIQVPIDFARGVYRLPEDSATQIGVILRRPQDQAETLERIRSIVAGQAVAVRPWQEVQPELASYIRLDRGSNWIFQALLVMLVLFTIFNTVLMSVLERQREFAVLLALGTRPADLRRQVFVETGYLALLGCLIGLAIGAGAAGAMERHGLDLRAFYPHGMTVSGLAIDPVLHARISVGMLAATSGAVLAAILMLGVTPMRQATRLHMVDWLR
jgi:ABC-type lipoprotein release transport system permease subunit